MRNMRAGPVSALFDSICTHPIPSRAFTTATRSRPSPHQPFLPTQQIRHRHVSLEPRPTQVPPPTPFVPDVPTFLKLIGRDLKNFTEKFPTWEALFTLTSAELKELGIQPARTRKYLLRWLEKFRNGEYGPGGDFAYVRDGVAALRVARDVRRDTAWVVNIPLDADTFVPAKKSRTAAKGGQDGDEAEKKGKIYPGASTAKLAHMLENQPRESHAIPRQYHAHGTGRISGPFVIPNPREVGGATVRLVERMWEERRGVKLDGGERRRDRLRFERRVAERKAQREAREAEEIKKRGG